MKKALIIILAVFLVSCADSHQLMRLGGEVRKLNPDGIIYVSIPADGHYGDTDYQGSGQNTTQIVVMAFAKHANRVESGRTQEDFATSLEAARKMGAKYLVAPTILAWEDRATEWSGIPDKVSIKLSVIDVSTGATLDSVIINGKSGLATLGGDHPQDLLPKPIEEYVTSLY